MKHVLAALFIVGWAVASALHAADLTSESAIELRGGPIT